MPDYCSGAAATCAEDVFRADGTECTEGGEASKCYRGSCLGTDAQCAAAFTGFQGAWVAHAKNGLGARCDGNDECGELECVNTQWDDYCTSYDCPSGYRCTAAGFSDRSGPWTSDYCRCSAKSAITSVVTPVYVLDGTPCDVAGGQDKICWQRACVGRAAASAAGAQVTTPGASSCVDERSCNNNGKCGQTLDGTGTVCHCDPGFRGGACGEEVPCDTGKCNALNRQWCVTDDLCGTCHAGWASDHAGALGPDEACDMADLHWMTQTASAGNAKALVNAGRDAIDGDAYSHWKAAFDPQAVLSDKPKLTIEYASPQQTTDFSIAKDTRGIGISYATSIFKWLRGPRTPRYASPQQPTDYTLTSGNAHPEQDPKSWTVYCHDADRAAPVVIDTRSGELFESRHQARQPPPRCLSHLHTASIHSRAMCASDRKSTSLVSAEFSLE